MSLYCPECSRLTPDHADSCPGEAHPVAARVTNAPPPQVVSESDRQLAGAHPEDFRSPAGLGSFAFMGLAYMGFSAAFSIYTAVRYRAVLADLAGDTFTGSFQSAIDIENAYRVSGLLDLAGALVIALTWLLWMRRLRANVVALGRTPQYRAAWIFWGWITPILNWFRPYQVIADLWRKSDPEAGPGSAADPPPPYLGWWITYVITNRLATSLIGFGGQAETLDQIHSAVGRQLFLDVLVLPSIILAIVVIRTLTARQITAGAELGRRIVDNSAHHDG